MEVDVVIMTKESRSWSFRVMRLATTAERSLMRVQKLCTGVWLGVCLVLAFVLAFVERFADATGESPI
jgi:preprotein translocase subunit SecG